MFSKLLRVSKLSASLVKAFPPRCTVTKSFLSVSRASFSTSLEKVDKVKSKLQKALQKELKYEEENYQKDDTVEVIANFFDFYSKET